jgi:ABC-type multidrug transport system ATPase subunit
MTVTTSGLGKRFNREWIFCGLDQKFQPGKTYAVTGPNGSGKSTLMQVLWGQMHASEGGINYSINSKIIPHEDLFAHVSIAAPYLELIEEFSLEEQVDFHFKFKKPENGLSANEIIHKMQLRQASKKQIRQFSSGMKQRLKLGLAMFSESNMLFLDEPTTNLDTRSVDWYMENLMESNGKKLIFIATNQPSDYPEGTEVVNLSNLKRPSLLDLKVTNQH